MKKIFSSVLVVMMLIVGAVPFGASTVEIETRLDPVYACSYKWETYGKKSYLGLDYGSYKNGPSITGTGTLTAQGTIGTDKNITGTFSGTKKVGNSSFTAGLGYSIGKNYSKGISYSIKGEKGKTKQIRYRPTYKKYKVNQREYKSCTGGGSTTKKYTGKKATGYALKPDSWNFSWRYK